MSHSAAVGGLLEDSASLASQEALLVAPFIKRGALSRVLRRLPTGIPITVVTRWHPAEIAAGVSDLACRRDVLDRTDSRFLLCQNLHAKYYRFDERVYLGSANLTGTALGWHQPANLELLQPASRLQSFEAELAASSFAPTEEFVEVMTLAVEALAGFSQPFSPEKLDVRADSDKEASGLGSWIPHCRDPSAIHDVLVGNTDDVDSSTHRAALRDIAFLDLHAVPDIESFSKMMRSLLLGQDLIRQLSVFAEQPRRFGEVREWLETYDSACIEPSRAAQTIYRWTAHFLPDDFEVTRANYSEIIQCRSRQGR